MRLLSSVGLYGVYAGLASLWQGANAQLGQYTDPETGIVFSAQTITDSQTDGGFMWGWALPPDAGTVDATEYIGIIVGAINTDGGYAGISHGGAMPSALLLAAWPNEDDVVTSFRFATGYVDPNIYTGDAVLSPISKSVNETHYTIIYRCEGCWSWNQDGTTGSRSTSSGTMVIGWCQSYEGPVDPADSGSTIVQHDTQGLFGAPVASAVNEQYTEWASLATPTTSTGPTTTTTTGPTITGIPVPTDTTFDYIVVGSGAGGMPMADRLSEAGNSVLLLEKGPPSSYRWGGRLGPDWLDDTNLTRFDVPGLCNEIWVDSAGIACSDIDVMAGCVVGGGTAVNSGLWWKGPSRDWDYNFPSGWKSGDMQSAMNKVFDRIPWNSHPSMDGKLYLQEGFDVIAEGLDEAYWIRCNANEVADSRQQFYSLTPFMFSHGERGGPMATYLVSMDARPNTDFWMNTMVRRVIRDGGHITGVEVEPTTEEGYRGVVNVTPDTGRVILSAGTFGSAKILFRSGIGPQDMLEVVQSSSTDGDTMIDPSEWINLPVGYNLVDHVNTDMVIKHPNVVFYDYYAAFDDPIPEDRDNYLNNRSGPLATAAPNIGPMFWNSVVGSDGIQRQFQWTARVEGSHGEDSLKAMTISQYLGTGSTSRGRTTITPSLSMTVSELPYLRDQADVDAVVEAIDQMMTILSGIPDMEWSYPEAGTSAADFVAQYPITTSLRTANHWMGSCKMGEDDGRDGGTAVVDLNTKVYGTDNLFIVDASIFPGMTTCNPSALIVSAAEHAVGKVLAA